MTKSWKNLDHIQWTIKQPVKDAYKYNQKSDKSIPLTKTDWDAKLPIKSGDHVLILSGSSYKCKDGKKCIPAITEPIQGDTVRDLLNAIYKGTHKKFSRVKADRGGCKVHTLEGDYNLVPEFYRSIGGFFSGNTRVNLVNRFENGPGIMPIELYGDHIFFEGARRSKNYPNLVEFGTGS